jgi:DNA-binding transcriptional regulator of glucitol operon
VTISFNPGYHSLRHWGFIVHGGIDGKTRCGAYMIVVTDNKASTVAEAFLGAVEIWGWPSRVLYETLFEI